jgi:hypothetical protein
MKRAGPLKVGLASLALVAALVPALPVHAQTSASSLAGQESNWITTKKGGLWFATFRLYGPDKPFFDKSWKLPDIEEAN